MSTINESISKVRIKLLKPKEQAPSPETVFDSLVTEYQNQYNDLENSNLPWSYSTATINLVAGQMDYLVPQTGRVLFVTAQPYDQLLPPLLLEFADLADISTDFWLFSPLDYGFAREFNEIFWNDAPFQVAFYRNDSDLYMRVAPFVLNNTVLTITFSTGSWVENLTMDSVAVLKNHHGLVETRASINILPGCEWSENLEADEVKRGNLMRTLAIQEERQSKNFMYAKRSINADVINDRVGYGDEY